MSANRPNDQEGQMTAERSVTSPPTWAESLLRLLLTSKDRESVSGDLLEEYRESIVPALGVWRYLLDTLVPIHYTPGVIALRSAVMSWALIATFFGCGAWHAWR